MHTANEFSAYRVLLQLEYVYAKAPITPTYKRNISFYDASATRPIIRKDKDLISCLSTAAPFEW